MQLRHLHLQLTQACNLNCGFCGQKHVAEGELDSGQWLALLDEAAQLPVKPLLTIWGGEPLLSPFFPIVAEKAAASGFELELITNGTMVDGYCTLLREKFKRIYVSVDGPEAVHDRIRGKGVFARVKDNLAQLAGGDAEIIIMSVLAPETMATAAEAPYGLPVDRVIFHELIYLEEQEMPDGGGAWKRNCSSGYRELLAATLEKLRQVEFPVPAEFQPHGTADCCSRIYDHLHISSRGGTSFCTDFTDYTLGNVTEKSLQEIFTGKAAAEQRRKVEADEFPYCRHCAWRNNAGSIIKFRCRT